MPRSNPYTACADFHRTAADPRYRDAALSRRQFISFGVGAGLSLYAARALPMSRALDAAAVANAAAPDGSILVTIFLPGGLDLLDSLVPLDQYGAYRDKRGALAQNEVTTPKLGKTGLGIHQALTQGTGGGIKGLYDAGKVGFLPGIDYANPDLSHFHSRHFWETGLVTARETTGWLGRWLDHHGASENPFQGITSGSGLSPLLRSGGAPVAAVESAAASALTVDQLSGPTLEAHLATWAQLAASQAGEGAGPGSVRRAARLAQRVAEALAPYAASAPTAQPGGEGVQLPGPLQPTQNAGPGYPEGGFAQRLQSLAFLLSQPLGTRLATVDANADFDTHDGQPARLAVHLKEISQALAAFQTDLEQRGIADRVLTFVWSEFGRRPQANTSQGTDHGAGGVAWVQGVRARSGILTEYPRLTDLDPKQNLKVTADFRQVYASLIEQWLGTDAAEVLPDAPAFSRLTLTT